MTSVYEARIENIALHDPYGDNLDFTVTPIASIWGSAAPGPFRLSFEAGACSNWFFLMESVSPPRDGLKVIVMANPEGLADNHQLYILTADSEYIDSFMSDWRAARAGQPLSRHP